MRRFVIEREIAGIGLSDQPALCAIATTSNAALARLAPKVQWDHSYVTGDKTFCVYLADDEEAILEHARISGFPANKITPVMAVIDPTTAR
ncbi:MAG TPA: DUF4242 domain-containing protein [Devosia sp.]|nr:DUF4242 domain-containing protein [Devosia sp.]